MAVTYDRITLKWIGGTVSIEGERINITANNSSDVYEWGKVERILLTQVGDLEIISSPKYDDAEEKEKKINVTVEFGFSFSVVQTTRLFSIWNSSKESPKPMPWLHLTSFPLATSGHDILSSSGMLKGLTQYFPHCSNFSCIVSQCPPSSYLPACCNWVMGHSLLSRPGYPTEATTNYISFSRLRPCEASAPFSDSKGCGEGWVYLHRFFKEFFPLIFFF